jgi:hypothetical protein
MVKNIYEKTEKVIKSCVTSEQYTAAKKMVKLLSQSHPNVDTTNLEELLIQKDKELFPG